jgi:DNA-binding CsgD family transcriptional regulator/tetratricopeptide (TPR) repeat protein
MAVFGEVLAAKTVDLFERTDELGSLSALVTGAAQRDSGIGVVRGPPGVGKTSLLTAARTDALGHGIRVLSARGSPHERDYPFAVVSQLLGPVVLAADAGARAQLFSGPARHAQRLFEPPGEDSSASSDAAYATLYGLFWLLAGIAEYEPVLVVVDDAHLCDAPSGWFLSFLARRLEGLAVTLLLAERSGDGEVDAWLSEIGDDPRARMITPRPLSPTAVTAIAAGRLSGDVDDVLGQACWEATGGNPFFVRAALDELAREDVIGEARLEQLHGLGPEAVLRSVLVRLARSPAGAVTVAHAVAVLGDGAALDDTAELAELPLARARSTADGLTELGVFAADGRGLSFAHPIVRNALYRDLTSGARERLHARAATMLMGAGVSATQIAVHVLRSARGLEGALDVLLSAARTALAQGAPQVAAGYFRRALEEPLDDERRAGLLIDLGSAEAQAGDAQAVEHLAAGLRVADDPERRADAALALAHMLAAGERMAESVAILTELGDDLTESHPQVAGRVFSELVSLGDLIARPLVPARARRLASSTDPAGLTHRAVELTAAAASAVDAGRLAELALKSGELLARGDAVFAFACAMLIYAEEYSVAQHHLDQALASAVAASSAPRFIGASGQRALLNARRGRLVDAEADARAALDVVSLHDWQPWQTHTLTMVIEALLARGQAPQAAVELERFLQFTDPPAGNQGALLLEARGRLRLELGDIRDAVDDLLGAGQRLEAWGLHNPSVAAWRSHAAIGLAALGQRARAVGLAEAEVALARRWAAPRALGVALRAVALVYNDERTIPLLNDACTTLARSQAPVEHARALTDLGAALRRENQRNHAREHLRAALEIAHSTGALSLAQRAHTELTATGARPRMPLRIGIEALTPSERRIAQMASGGLTNMAIAQDLFVTLKTVEMHLTSTYRKLDISSRAQLVDALTAQSSP